MGRFLLNQNKIIEKEEGIQQLKFMINKVYCFILLKTYKLQQKILM